MLDDLKCKIGLHKPYQEHYSYKYKFRTSNKGRSKKRWYTGAKELVTVTRCERCYKILKEKRKWKWK